MDRKLRILTTPWHVSHFYDLFTAMDKDADFFLLPNNWRPWFRDIRPLPRNASFVPYLEKEKYDLAIIDVDQQCVLPEFGKSKVFRRMKEITEGMPRVVINHGGPVYPEKLRYANYETLEQAEDRCRDTMRKLVKGIPMVVNSHAAASEKEWGWGTPIWHGISPDNWLDLPKEPRVFTALSPGGTDTYYNRERMNEVAGRLEDYGYTLYWAKINVGEEKYKDMLGSSLIYLDTSFRTPMNRARTEAMLSGACVVQVEGAHDLEMFAKDGENMVIVPDNTDAICRTIVDLIENRYHEAVDIGQSGKETAIEKFNPSRYRDDWMNLIKSIV